MGLGGPKQKYSPPNKRKPISPFGLGLMYFFFNILFDQSQEPLAGRNVFFTSNFFDSKLQPKLATP